MEDETLNRLIELINPIYTNEDNDAINECMEILGISVSPFEIEEEKMIGNSKSSNYINVYIKKIIETIEKRLTDEQKEIFYKGIETSYVVFTKNEELKKEVIINMINENKILDYKDDVNSFAAKVLSSIKSDSLKVGFINKYKDNLGLDELEVIAESLEDDNLKLKYMDDLLEEPYCLGYLIVSIKDDNLKKSLYEKYEEDLDGYLSEDIFISSLNSDDLKLEKLKDLGPKKVAYKRLIYGLNEEESLMKIWDKLDDRGKAIAVYKTKDVNKKFELIKRINSDSINNEQISNIPDIDKLIIELPEDSISYIINECQNIKLSYMDLIGIVNKLTSEDEILNLLSKRGEDKISRYVRKNHLLSPECMLQNLELFLEIEEATDISDVRKNIEYLYETNNDILYSIDWNILRPKYLETLGLDKINVIGSFEALTNSILIMTDKEYDAFYHSLNHYIEKEGSITWQSAAYQMMEEIYFSRVDNNDFCNYIDDINKVDLDNLLHILLNGDNLGIKSLDDINNYDNLLKDRCNKLILEGNIVQKRDSIFIKYFGLSDLDNNGIRQIRSQEKNGMGRIYHLYKNDINLIENEEIKELFNFIKRVLDTTDEAELLNIYNSRSDFGHIDTYKLERELKNELLKLYNKELLQVENLPKNEDGLYEAGVDFSAITTSVGAYVKNSIEDYKKDWNRPSLASGHFCASYIRNDMIGTAPVPNVMYGFSHMEPYSLVLSGATDIGSSGASFISKAYDGEEYLGPDRQINETAYNEKYKYNEMDFSRIQNGKKKGPDYIIVFRRDGNLEKLDEARKASKDWGELPIVVIDVDKCLKHEQELVENMLNEYYTNPSEELLNRIKTKIMNNRVTNPTFLERINIDELTISKEEIENNVK